MNRIGFGLGFSLLLAPLVLAFNSVVELRQGLPNADPEDLTRDLIIACVVFGFGSVVGYIGYVVVGYNFDALPSRPRWLYGVMLLIGILWLPHLGLGACVGLALLVFTIRKRDQFESFSANGVEAPMLG